MLQNIHARLRGALDMDFSKQCIGVQTLTSSDYLAAHASRDHSFERKWIDCGNFHIYVPKTVALTRTDRPRTATPTPAAIRTRGGRSSFTPWALSGRCRLLELPPALACFP